MRIHSISAQGWLSLRKPSAVNIDDLPGVLCAIIGPNGAGKSSFLELLVGGALYRKLPTRGAQKGASNLTAFAVDRDAFVEVNITNGANYTIRQLVNAVNGKAESFVTDVDGKALVPSAKTDAYMEWAEVNLPPAAVIYASQFIKQKDEGFADLDAAKRKSVVLKALGIDRWEIMASLAGKKARDIRDGEKGLTFHEAILSSYGDLATADLPSLCQKAAQLVISARADRDAADKTQTDAEEVYNGVKRQIEAAKAEIAQNQRQRDGITAAEARVIELKQQGDELRNRLAAYNELLAEEPNLAGLRAKYDELNRKIAIVDQAIREKESALTKYESDLRNLATTERMQTDAIVACRSRVDAAVLKQGERSAIEQAQADLPKAEEQLTKWETELTAARAASDELSALHFDNEAGRVKNLRGGIKIAIQTVGPADKDSVLTTTLEHDDKQVTGASEYPRKVNEARQRITTATSSERTARTNLESLRRTIERLSEVEAAAEVERCERVELERNEKALAETRTAIEISEQAQADLCDAVRALDFERAEMTTSRDQIPIKDLEDKMLTARASVKELTELSVTCEAAILVAQDEVGRICVPGIDPTVPDDAPARKAWNDAQTALLTAKLQLELAERAQVDLAGKVATIQQVRDMVATMRDEFAQWSRLEIELGKNGLQAMEIDASGPELTDTVNDLLHSCVGSRWTVEIQTARDSGKKTIEGFEIIVIDSQADSEQKRRAELKLKSGGERVIIGEAVSLALSMLACRRSGVAGPTLIRDESGAALDEDNGPQWIAMLRRAAAITGASKVLYVAHQRALQDLADSRILINQGTVQVVL